MRAFQPFTLVIGLMAVLLLTSSTFTPEIVYLKASKAPIRIKPAHNWTQDVPNSEHEDKCIFNEYRCPERFYFQISQLFDDFEADTCSPPINIQSLSHGQILCKLKKQS
ncbi:hypothetical protein HIMB100_00006140 [SAR116 cluster alpha proteobacterium HIMB100]|nr:hypothetical protein HIMB100_00006140 [SAR116 cluster alpha proteobacterium HIMB100]